MGGERERDGNICRCKFENLKKKGSKRQNKRIGRHEYLAPHPQASKAGHRETGCGWDRREYRGRELEIQI